MLDTWEEKFYVVDDAITKDRNRYAYVFRSLRKMFPNYYIRALGIVENISRLERLVTGIDSSDTSMLTVNGVYKFNGPRPRHYSYLRKNKQYQCIAEWTTVEKKGN